MGEVVAGPREEPVGAGDWHHAGRTLVELLRYRARLGGDELLYGFLDSELRLAQSLTYRSLLRRATGFARLLRARGLGGRSVLLAFPQGPEFVVAFFAVNIAGAVPVPVRLPRRSEETAMLARMALDAEAAAVLVTGRQRSSVEQRFATERTLAALPVVCEPSDGEPSDGGPIDTAELAEGADLPVVRPQDVALLQYTSGSTSDPKGVQVTHANLLANSEAIRTGFGNDRTSVTVSWLPMFHDMGLIGGVLQPLYVGFPEYFMNPTAVLQEPSRWLAAVSRYRATVSGGPNFGYELCLARPPRAGSEPLDLSAWRVAYSGAEPVLAATIDRFRARFAADGFSPRAFYPCYGLAEATLMVTGGHADDDVRTLAVDGEELARGRVAPRRDGPSVRRITACGPPRPGVELAIVDPESGRPAVDGRVGEIWVAGPIVAAGYRNRAELNARTFGASLADRPGTAFLRTGDLGFLDQGQLFVVGRLHDMIVIRGRNLYPEDIETSVIAACARWNVTGCAVFAGQDPFVPDVQGPDAQGIVVAVELPGRGEDGRQESPELTARVRERVAAGYGVTVRDVVAVDRWRLPRTSSGKVRRSECARRYRSGELNGAVRQDGVGSGY